MVRPHLPPAIGVCRAELWYDTPSGTQLNVLNLHSEDLWDQSALSLCASRLVEWWIANAAPLTSNQVSLRLVRATDLTAPTSQYLTYQPSPVPSGDLSSDLLPASVTIAVHAVTGFRGTGRQGRYFWVGLTEGQVTNGVVNQSDADDIVAAMNELITVAITEIHARCAVLHRTFDGVTLNPAEWTEVMSYAITDRHTDVMTPRLPNHERRKRNP